MATEEVLFPSLYEENYILRSLGSIVTQPDIALTELIANAWDAGASTVNIAIPEDTGQTLYIEDDGTGMSEEEFQNRWMKLRYDRLRTQGRKVVFPDGSDKNRYAFGRNGVGRHGLFCFGNQYTVITKKDGKQMTFVVKPIVGFLVHHLLWQDTLTTVTLQGTNRNVQQLRQVLIVKPLVLMKWRILYRLWHSQPLLRDEQLGNLLQLFLQALVLLNEKLYQKAVLLNFLLQPVEVCHQFYVVSFNHSDALLSNPECKNRHFFPNSLPTL